MLSFCISWLTDSVSAIREIGCKLMKKLHDLFKGEEFEKKLLEKLHEMKVSSNYLIRNTVLHLAREFGTDEFDVDFLEKKLTSIIFKLCKDKIPNVRGTAATLLKKMSRIIRSKDVLKEILSHLEELKRDQDVEVAYAIMDN